MVQTAFGTSLLYNVYVINETSPSILWQNIEILSKQKVSIHKIRIFFVRLLLFNIQMERTRC